MILLTSLPSDDLIIVPAGTTMRWEIAITESAIARTIRVIVQEGAIMHQRIQLVAVTGSLRLEYILGRGSRMSLQASALLRQQQQLQITTMQQHEEPYAASTTKVYTVVQDQATLQYEAAIYIAPSAVQTEAVQHNKNLLLSPRAVVHAKPTLAVLHDHVTCSHGSATEYLDPLQRYALMSRGLPSEQAEQLLIDSFLREMVV
ncbi:SufD family Fe-S cluster assembly protein [Candidatus Dependentiae bacterium]|nr:SufD family Fe-S cluster assembly protein [Candidatus Dependentiae bacterium]